MENFKEGFPCLFFFSGGSISIVGVFFFFFLYATVYLHLGNKTDIFSFISMARIVNL